MKLYDGIISDSLSIIAAHAPKLLGAKVAASWKLLKNNEVILTKETAFELGGGGLKSVTFSAVTSEMPIDKDEILLIGKDLNEIRFDTPFARLVFLKIEDIGDSEQEAYKVIKDLEYSKYDIIPEGYMVRASAFDCREQVRVSKNAIRDGLNFEAIGNIYIDRLKQNDLVKNVKIVFITESIPEFKILTDYAKKINDITLSLNHIMADMSLDCNSCNLKQICDEVEGLRELHFKNAKKP